MSAKNQMIQFVQGMQQMPLEKAEVIVNLFHEKQFSKNDNLIRSGKICNEYYFLVDGYVRSHTTNYNGEDITTGFSSSGQIVCELFSFFKRVSSKEDFQALSDCTVLCIPFENVQTAFHSIPEFRELGRSILVNAYANLKQEMIAGLQETAEERYGRLVKSTPEIFQHAQLKNIASYLGVTDSSLSRIRKEFVKK